MKILTPRTTVLLLHSKSNKKNIDKSNEIDDIDFVTRNRYLPLENIDESFDSSSGDNLLQSERNVVAIKKNAAKTK